MSPEKMRIHVLAYLKGRPDGARFVSINAALQHHTKQDGNGFREIDRALQWLRRKGLIEYRGPARGWHVVRGTP